MRQGLRSTLCLAALLSHLGCRQASESEGKEARKTTEDIWIDKRLHAISREFALIDAEVRFRGDIECLMDELKVTHAPDPDPIARAIHEESAVQERARCDAYRMARSELALLRESVLKSGVRPKEGYLFFVWSPSELEEEDGCPPAMFWGDEACEHVIGVFSTMASCQRAEESLRAVDIGTRPCRPWDSVGGPFIRAMPTRPMPVPTP